MVEPWHRSCPHGVAGDLRGPATEIPTPHQAIILRLVGVVRFGSLSWRPLLVVAAPVKTGLLVARIALANSFATCGRHSQEATGFASGAEANRA
jgi:hypothetical protein